MTTLSHIFSGDKLLRDDLFCNQGANYLKNDKSEKFENWLLEKYFCEDKASRTL